MERGSRWSSPSAAAPSLPLESSSSFSPIQVAAISRHGRPAATWMSPSEPGGEVTRQYSLCGSPHNLGTYRIAVLLEQAGRGGSRSIHESVLEGDLITTRGPRSNFALDAAERYLFIGGGIGITPLLPMLATADSSEAQWQLLYGGRTRQSMAYLDELSRFGSQVAIRPESESGLLPVAGFLAEPDGRTLVYCCGPDRLLRAVAAAMRTWPARSLRVERFAASQLAPRKVDRAIEVALARTGMTLIVPPGQSILEALEEASPSSRRAARVSAAHARPGFSLAVRTTGTRYSRLPSGRSRRR